MLKEIILRDFFSFYGETRVKLNKGVNLLLGINGSGKTSFINAIRLLCEGVSSEGIGRLIQEQWGGCDQILNFNGERNTPYAQLTYVFDYAELNKLNAAANFTSDVFYRITLRPMGTSYSLCEHVFTRNHTQGGIFDYLKFSNGTGKISARREDGTVVMQDYKDGEVSGQGLVLRQINDPQHYLPTYTLRKAIETMAVYAGFEVGENSRLRYPAEYSTDVRLRKTGSNLTQILNDIKLNHRFDFERLENMLSRVNPHFKGIDISNRYGLSYLSLLEENMQRAIGSLHISDGTLRFLLLECIFYNTQRGNLVGIDEPERGLHPDMIRSVAEMVKMAARQTQIIAATHSPYLLNQFELEDILVFEKDDNNATTVHRKCEEDFPEWEGEYLPGQMWLCGMIGGKRW